MPSQVFIMQCHHSFSVSPSVRCPVCCHHPPEAGIQFSATDPPSPAHGPPRSHLCFLPGFLGDFLQLVFLPVLSYLFCHHVLISKKLLDLPSESSVYVSGTYFMNALFSLSQGINQHFFLFCFWNFILPAQSRFPPICFLFWYLFFMLHLFSCLFPVTVGC